MCRHACFIYIVGATVQCVIVRVNARPPPPRERTGVTIVLYVWMPFPEGCDFTFRSTLPIAMIEIICAVWKFESPQCVFGSWLRLQQVFYCRCIHWMLALACVHVCEYVYVCGCFIAHAAWGVFEYVWLPCNTRNRWIMSFSRWGCWCFLRNALQRVNGSFLRIMQVYCQEYMYM